MLTLLLICTQASLAVKPVMIGPLKGNPPASWVREKPANLLRSDQFKLPAATETDPGAQLVVYPESSPKYEQKFREWRETITPSVGADPAKVIVESQMPLAGGAVAHRLDATGTWKYRERPRDPTSKTEILENQRVIWVVIIHPDGATHVRLSGPQAVVSKHLDEFDRWLKGLK